MGRLTAWAWILLFFWSLQCLTDGEELCMMDVDDRTKFRQLSNDLRDKVCTRAHDALTFIFMKILDKFKADVVWGNVNRTDNMAQVIHLMTQQFGKNLEEIRAARNLELKQNVKNIPKPEEDA